MACFVVPAVEAAVVKAVEKIEEKKEQQVVEGADFSETEVKIPLSRKLKWLNYMLLGGAVLLLFEHIWHGEIAPWFPFLTAMSDPADAAAMFTEMATVGLTMAGLITAVWVVMCVAAGFIVKRHAGKEDQTDNV